MTQADVTPFSGVQRRPDANTYQFGLRVPKDLRQHFPGPWAVRLSLGTADLRAANDKAKRLHAEWADKFDALRAGKASPVDLTRLRRKLLAYAERYLATVDRQSAGYPPAEREQRASEAALDRAGLLHNMEQGHALEDHQEQWLAGVLRSAGFQRCPVTEGEALPFLAMLLELRHESLTDSTRTFPLRVERLAARRALLAASASATNTTATRPASPAAPADAHRIGDALDAWKKTQKSEKTIGAFARHAGQFVAMMGDPILASLKKPDAVAFRDKLQEWAVSERKTVATADNVLVSIRALVNVARDRGWIESNPFAGLAVKIGGKAAVRREPWTHEDLCALFDDPLFKAYSLPAAKTAMGRKAGADAAYWIPLIACCTGARVSEIAQLWTDDVATAKGAEVIEFRANADRGQGLKNAASWRAVPMHSELIRLGLPQYVDSLPIGPLFPKLPTSGKNGPGGQFGQWFGAYKLGKGFASGAKTMHSFRHMMATELRHAGVTEPLADAITGHAGEGVARTVYSVTLRRDAEKLRPWIERLQFEALRRLPRVAPAGSA